LGISAGERPQWVWDCLQKGGRQTFAAVGSLLTGCAIDSMEFAILGGSALLHLALFNLLGGDPRGDGAKLKSCYLSHLHLSVSVTSCLIYWLTQPVELSNAKWMVEGPSGWNSDWMRRTISFSVGYLINDLFLMIKYPVVGGTDMVVHHIICILFWGSGVLDRLGTEKNPPCVPNASVHAASTANVPRSCKLRGGSFLPHLVYSPGSVCAGVARRTTFCSLWRSSRRRF
jgi:hypothetical protein